MAKAKLVAVDNGTDDQPVEKRTMTTLKMADNFKLIQFIIDEYTKSGLSDGDFAERASEHIGIKVNASHISNRRAEFDIIANSKVPVPPTPELDAMAAQLITQAKQIVDLQERMAMLEGWVNSTFPNKGPKPAIVT